MFATGVTAILSNFSEAVVAAICDPYLGLPGKFKRMPALSEIREACERERALAEPWPPKRAESERSSAPIGPEEAQRRREVVRQWRRDEEARAAEARRDLSGALLAALGMGT